MKQGTKPSLVFLRLHTLLFISLLGPLGAHAAPVDDVRNILKEWVETEKTISQEQESWRQEKDLLENVLSSLNQEERVLNNTIATAQQATSRADDERLELISRREFYQRNSSRFADQLGLFERQAVQLIPQLPIILRDEMGLMINRLYQVDDASYSLGQRAQNLINILSAIQKFDSSITVSNEIRTLNTGDKIEVRVLYLGLSRAFYAAKDERMSGIGRPLEGGSEDGWQWIEQIDLADDINDAIDIYENVDTPGLIQLPLSLQIN